MDKQKTDGFPLGSTRVVSQLYIPLFDKNVFLFQFFNVFLFCGQKNKSIRIHGEVKLSKR